MKKRRQFQTGGPGPSDAAIGKAALLSDPEAQAALADTPAPKPVHPQVARALAVASLRRQRRQALANAGMPPPSFRSGGDYGDYMWDARKDPMDPSQQPDGQQDGGTTDSTINDWLDLGLLNSRRGGHFQDPEQYTPPSKKAQGGSILRRRPHPVATVPQDGGREDVGTAPGRHVAIPVISTTIIIAHHKKPKKAEKPKEKPKKDEKPGKMAQGGLVPRGSGIEKRGRRFTGIF